MKVCVATGSRADYGLLAPLLRALSDHPRFELQVLATGMHLAPEFGLTATQIEADGYTIDRRVEMLLASDTPGGVAKSVGLGVIGASDALEALRPDLLVVLGDRFEMLAVAQAALFQRVPLAHLCGGDTTEGAYDEAIRHAITKMAHLHFVTNERSAERVRRMGEDPARVHVAGSTGLDTLRALTLLSREALAQALGMPLARRNLLITHHPATLGDDALAEFGELLAALETLDDGDTAFWFTYPNADDSGRALAQRLEAWVAARPHAHAHRSLGSLRYLSLMAQADAVVGNSSSGLYEAPSLRVPTVDIGERQRSRLAAASVLHCAPERGAIRATIERAFALDCRSVVNPYGDGHAAERIVRVLEGLGDPRALLRKRFHGVEG